MTRTVLKRFKGFKHSIIFQFSVNIHAVPKAQVCYAYALVEGVKKNIAFSPQWPVLMYETGVVKKLSDDDRAYRIWRDAAFDIIDSRLDEFSNMILQDKTDRDNFSDLEELREDFLPWQIDRINKTGDVEEGAEVALQTQQGQELLQESIAGGRSLTPSLKKKITQSVDHKNALLKQHIKEKGENINGGKSTHRGGAG